MEIINITDVLDITPEDLVYLDASGQEKQLSFEDCRRNWVVHVNENDFRDWKPKLKIELKPNKEPLTKVQKELPGLLYRIGKVTIFDMT